MNLFQSKWVSLFVMFFIVIFSNAQEGYGIKGTVVDSLDQPIESGNVIVLSPSDSTVIKGIHFWEGKFELQGIDVYDVLIKVTANGYQTHFESKSFDSTSSETHDLGNYQLTTAVQNLDGVSVVYKKPMYEREMGKLIMNVEGTSLSLKGTVYDLLKSAPNVIVRSNGAISVAGKGGAILYLDGQRVMSIEMLKSIPSTNVKTIEVIDNPSSRYDAEGFAVIEIITIEGAKNGYDGNIGIRGMKRTQSQAAYWANFSLRKDWFSMRLSAYQYTGTLVEDEDYYRHIFSSDIEMENDISRENKHNFWTGVYLNTDYRLDSLNTLFLNYSFERRNNTITSFNTNEIFQNSIYAGDLNSTSTGYTSRLLHSISGGYTRELDTLGSDFRITGQYSNFDAGTNSEINQTTNIGSIINDQFMNSNLNDISVVSGQFDYSKRFKNDLNVDFGAKNALVTNESSVDFRYNDGGQFVTDSSLFNQFDYTENITAAYAEMKGEHKKFSYMTGLRYEWTTMKGNSFVGGNGVIDRNYHNLFPNVQMQYDFTKDLILEASYNNRIQRPQYQDLDPFVDFIDSLSSFRGNPNLVPSYSHNAELSLVYMEYASLTFGYSKAKNPMFLTVEQNPGTNTFSAITQNIESSEAYSIGLVLPYELTWWTTFNAFGYSFNEYTYLDNAALAVSNEPTFYISLYNEFRFKNLFNLELTYEYISPGSQGFFIAKPTQSIGGSISRKFLKDKLNLQFRIFDVLYTDIERAESTMGDFYVNYTSRADTKSFMLTATWNFGKIGDKSMKGSTIDGEERGRIKD